MKKCPTCRTSGTCLMLKRCIVPAAASAEMSSGAPPKAAPDSPAGPDKLAELTRTVADLSNSVIALLRKARTPAPSAATLEIDALHRRIGLLEDRFVVLLRRLDTLDRRTGAISPVAAPAGATPKPGAPVTPLPAGGMFEDDPRAAKPEPRLRMLPDVGRPGNSSTMCVDRS